MKKASFREDFLRYPSPTAIQNMIADWYRIPTEWRPYDWTRACRATNTDEARVLGGNQPITGQPVSQEINPTFLAWYTACLKTANRAERDMNIPNGPFTAEMKEYLAPSLSRLFVERWPTRLLWRDLSAEEKATIVEEMVLFMVGTDDVLLRLSLTENPDQFRKEIVEKTDRIDKSNTDPVMQYKSEGLSLLMAVQTIKMELATKDILRY